LKMAHHFCDGAVRFSPVVTVNQQIASEPVQQAEKRNPQQAFLTDSHRGRQHNAGGSHHIVVILMVSDIDCVTEVFCAFWQALFDLQAKQRRKMTEQAAKRRNVLWITWAEEAVNAPEHADQNAVDN